jgi:carbamoyl-phosphate synthase large subunit
MKNIMFCSVGRRGELMKIFRKEFEGKGTIVAVDNSNVAPALYIAEKQYIVPKINDKNYIPIILEICKKEKISGITTLIDPEISLLAQNKQELLNNNIIFLGSSYEVAELCFNKYKTYQFLKKNGFNYVKTYDSIEKFKLAYHSGEIEFPVFIKPINGSGSVGIKKINTFNELMSSMEHKNNFIIQEYMDGTEYDADIYVDIISGELVSAFTKKKLSTRIGGADKTISYKDKKLFDLIDELVQKLGLIGPADIDFFKKNGEYYISEINPRFGGAYLHAYACGINFPELILNNINGTPNNRQIGNFEENIVMMMYDSVVIKKAKDLILNSRS